MSVGVPGPETAVHPSVPKLRLRPPTRRFRGCRPREGLVLVQKKSSLGFQAGERDLFPGPSQPQRHHRHQHQAGPDDLGTQWTKAAKAATRPARSSRFSGTIFSVVTVG
ncbi:MAG: hypothetical protein EBS49_03260 [Verrucomicrobia bacterium]|nr:hypothetical protein [Verrucomicrobiota bacterium]